MLSTYQTLKTGSQTINANDKIVADAMLNIDAEYEALCAEFALVTV